MRSRFEGPAPRIGADRAPVDVTRPDGSVLSRARAVLTSPDAEGWGRLLVWVSPTPEEPAVDVVYERDASVLEGSRWSVATPAGVFAVVGLRGCSGCSGLTHMPWPWSTYRMGRL